jgi:DNA-binding beta-propeller fold protein YncE
VIRDSQLPKSRRAVLKTAVHMVVLLVTAAGFATADGPLFRVTKRYRVPGDGAFDYIVFDGSLNRLYVSHGTAVDVLDADSGKVLGKVDGTPGVHGIAIVPKLHLGFTTNGGNATVSVFDTISLRIVKTIPVAKGPDFIFFVPQTDQILVCHEDGAAITAINPERQTVTGKIDLGSEAESAVVDSSGRGFVNLEKENTLLEFDPAALAVKQRWPITGCKAPTPLAVDIANSRLFIGCRSRVLAVMDANNGRVIATLPIGDTVDGVVFDAESKLIFASNSDGTISVIRQKSPNDYESLSDIHTQRTAKTMAFDPTTKRLFLSAVEMESALSVKSKTRTMPKSGSFVVLVVERQ